MSRSPYLTLQEAAEYLRLDSEEWLRERAAEVGIKLGRRWVFRADHLDLWYDRRLATEARDCRSTAEQAAETGTSASVARSIGARGRLLDLRP